MRKLDQASFEQAIISAWDNIQPTSDFSAMQKRCAPAMARLAYHIMSELQLLGPKDGEEILRLLATINASVLHNLSSHIHLVSKDGETSDNSRAEMALTFSAHLLSFVAEADEAVAAVVSVPTVDVGDA